MALSTLLGSGSAGTALTTASVLAAEDTIFTAFNGALLAIVIGLIVFMMWYKKRQT